MRWPHIDYSDTRPHEDTKPSTIYKKHSSMRQQPVDYHSTQLELRQDLKKSYSFTRWKLAKRHDLCIHTKWLLKQSSPKKNSTIHYKKSHIYMTRRRHSTSYCSVNFTIWSATGSASSTYLTNRSWSQVKHMPSPRTAIFAEGQYDLRSLRACATQFLEVSAKYSQTSEEPPAAGQPSRLQSPRLNPSTRLQSELLPPISHRHLLLGHLALGFLRRHLESHRPLLTHMLEG